MEYKGLSIPMDIPLFLHTVYKIYQFRGKIESKSLEGIFKDLEIIKPKVKAFSCEEDILKLKKIYRIVTWYYSKILNEDKPCFVRSLMIYEKAAELGIKVNIVVGFIRTDNIIGHSWNLIDDEIFMESEEFVKQYRKIIQK